MQAVHPVFHVSMLEPSIPNTIPDRVQTPPPPVMDAMRLFRKRGQTSHLDEDEE